MKTLLALLALAVLSGCTVTSYKDPSGASFSRISVGTKQSIGKVTVKAGDKSLNLEGYSNDQVETAAAVAGAVASALNPAK